MSNFKKDYQNLKKDLKAYDVKGIYMSKDFADYISKENVDRLKGKLYTFNNKSYPVEIGKTVIPYTVLLHD